MGMIKILKTLTESYDVIYEQILALDTYSKSLAKQAILLLLYARRQFRFHELLAAVFAGVQTTTHSDDGLPDTTHLLDLCCNLVVVKPRQASTFVVRGNLAVAKSRPPSTLVNLAHLSMKEYFEAKEDFQSKFGHSAVLNSSFAALLWDYHKLQPFRLYARSYWLAHLMSQGNGEGKHLIRFFRCRYHICKEYTDSWSRYPEWTEFCGSRDGPDKWIATGCDNVFKADQLYIACRHGALWILDESPKLQSFDWEF